MKKTLFLLLALSFICCQKSEAKLYFQKYNTMCKAIYDNNKATCKTIFKLSNINAKYKVYEAIIKRGEVLEGKKHPLRAFHVQELENVIKYASKDNFDAINYGIEHIYSITYFLNFIKENDFETLPKNEQDYVIELLNIYYEDKFSYEQAKVLIDIIKTSDEETLDYLSNAKGELANALNLIKRMIKDDTFKKFANETLCFDEKFQKELSERMPLNQRAYLYLLLEQNKAEAKEEAEENSENEENESFTVFEETPEIKDGDFYIKINDKYYDFATDIPEEIVTPETKLELIKKEDYPDKEIYLKALNLYKNYGIDEVNSLKWFYKDIVELKGIEKDAESGIYQEYYRDYYNGEFAHRVPERYYLYRNLKEQKFFTDNEIQRILRNPTPCHTIQLKYHGTNKAKVEKILNDNKLSNDDKKAKIKQVTAFRPAKAKETMGRIFYKFPRIRQLFILDEEVIDDPIPYIWK